ncbi:MAG: protein transport protein HofC [Candidatus Schmidhempelia sp.]|nr:protein transport protein HofC [Candidatus Schmidhempelia sp.]
MNNKKIYFWVAFDEQHHIQQGEIMATSSTQAKTLLIQRKYIPIKVRLTQLVSQRSFKKNTLLLITKQLTTMLNAGLPLMHCLKLIIDQHNNPCWRIVISEIKILIASGCSLSEALNNYPSIFPKVYRQLINTGELTGQLVFCLQELVIQQEKRLVLEKKIKHALRYPLFLMLITIIVTIVMLVFVLPQFAQIYADFNTELPYFTKLMMSITYYFQHAFSYLIIGMSLIYLSWYYYFYPHHKNSIQRKFLTIPIIGVLLHNHCLTLLFQILMLTQRAGIPLLQGINLAAQSMPYHLYCHSLTQIKKQIEQGYPLSQALQEDKALYSDLSIQFIQVGEESGTLVQMLTTLAQHYQQQTEELTTLLAQKIEPIMMIIMSIVIGSLIIAMYLPIFQLGNIIL